MKGIKCIDLIDEEKTIENGLMVCRQYAPALQQRLQDKLSTPMHSSSMINASSDTVYSKRDSMLLHRWMIEINKPLLHVTTSKTISIKPDMESTPLYNSFVT